MSSYVPSHTISRVKSRKSFFAESIPTSAKKNLQNTFRINNEVTDFSIDSIDSISSGDHSPMHNKKIATAHFEEEEQKPEVVDETTVLFGQIRRQKQRSKSQVPEKAKKKIIEP